MFQTLLGDSEMPSPTSSPWIRLYPQVGFLRREAQQVATGGRPRRVSPAAPDELAVPAQQRGRLDEE
jgi:hypothetical protein